MKLFSQAVSAASASVRVALNLKSVDYEHIVVGSDRFSHADVPARLRAAVPALAPVLLDKRRMFIERLAIIEYLDESYPQPPLLPGSVRDRAQIRSLAELIVSNLHPVISLRLQTYLDTPGMQSDASNQKWITDGLGLLENAIAANAARGYFSHGDDPGLADVCLVPEIWFVRRLGLDLRAYPTIQQIYDRCMELDAFNSVALGLS